MKKPTLLVLLITVMLMACQTESIDGSETTSDLNFEVFEFDPKNPNPNSREVQCFSTNLMAGQHHIAGTVSVALDEQNIILTYTTTEDWTIDLTHLSLGDCNEQWVPTTGSGNPKIGHFEHTEPHSVNTNEVVYLISRDAIEGLEQFCFAAHAEVHGPTGGETAWGEGLDFDGNSWAMYSQVYVGECTGGSNPPESE